ncbi:MAG: polysaccharide biosynthesis/export family protein [Paludibacter sp.]
MNKQINILIILLIALNFTSCYNYRSIGLLQEHAGLPTYPKSDYKEYKIRINDEIIYRLITSDETISKLIQSNTASANYVVSYRVYPDGSIDLPFIKNIHVEGLTLTDAGKAVEKRMREIIPDAEVKLSIANKTFTVIGDAGTGVFNIPRDRFTIYQALSMSGEVQHAGDYKHVRILRVNDKGTEILEFDIRPKSIIESKYYYIYPNDIIYVQRASSAFYKIENSWSNFVGVISSSLSLLFTVLYYQKL